MPAESLQVVFQRRNPIPLGQRLRSVLWPERGWHRTGKYIGHRLGRLPGTPHRIAAGFASGVAVSFTPFIGLHFVLAALLALLLRGNLVASAIGTVIGNPWTFPLIWAWSYALGSWFLGGTGDEALPYGFTLTHLVERPWDLFLPMLIGSAPTATAAWIGAYFPLRSLVSQYQKARRRRLRRKVKRRMAKGHPPRHAQGPSLAGRSEPVTAAEPAAVADLADRTGTDP